MKRLFERFRIRRPWALWAMAAVLGLALGAEARGQILACDVDLSGAVDAVDVQLVINAALGLETNAVYTNIDFNPSGATNAVDVQLVINAALGVEVDRDGDGLTDVAEANLGTDPSVFDTDGGGVGDGQEVIVDGTDPLDPTDDLIPGVPPPSFTATPTQGIAPLPVQFTDTTGTGSGVITAWLWNFGDGASSTEQNPEHVYQAPGVYTVALTITTTAGVRTTVEADLIAVTQVAGIAWIGAGSGNWNDPGNWEGGVVPGENDTAVVPFRTPPITVTVDQSTTVGDVFLSNNNFSVQGANTTLTARGALLCNGIFTLAPGTRLLANRFSALVTANGVVNIDNARLELRNGAQVSFPNLTSYAYTLDAPVTVFDVRGRAPANQGSVRSRLSMPQLNNLTFNSGVAAQRSLGIDARDHGILDLPNLRTLATPGTNDRIVLTQTGFAEMRLERLESLGTATIITANGGTLALPSLVGTVANVNLNNGLSSRIELPQLTGIEDGDVIVRDEMDMPALATLINTSVLVRYGAAPVLPALIEKAGGNIEMREDAVLTLSALTALGNTAISLRDNAEFSAPALTTYSPSVPTQLRVDNAGLFTAPQLTNIDNLLLRTATGGELILPAVIAYRHELSANSEVFASIGSGLAGGINRPSRLVLPNLELFEYNSGSAAQRNVSVLARNEGVLELPALETSLVTGSNDRVIYQQNDGGTLALPALAAAAHSHFWVQSGTVVLPAMIDALTNSLVTIVLGAMFEAPLLETMDAVTLDATGAFVSPSLTTVTNSNLTFREEPASLPALTAFEESELVVRDTASVSLGALTATTAAAITVMQSGELSMPLLHTFSPTVPTTRNLLMVRENGALLVPALTTIDNLTIQALNGGQLSLPLVTAYAHTRPGNEIVLEAAGTGAPADGQPRSTLDLPNLTAVSYNSGTTGSRSLTFRANNSGLLRLDALATVVTPGTNDTVAFTAQNGGEILLGSLASTPGIAVTAQSTGTIILDALGVFRGSLAIDPNAAVLLPALTAFEDATVSVRAPVDFPNLASMTNTSLEVRSGMTVALPSVDSVVGGGIEVREEAELTLAGITGLSNVHIRLRTGGLLDLPNLASYSPTIPLITLELQDAAALSAPLLDTIDNLQVVVSAGGELSLPLVTGYAYTLSNSSIPLDVNGIGAASLGNRPSNLAFPNLAGIAFNSGETGPRTLTFRARNGAFLELPSLSSVTLPGTNDAVTFSASQAGSVVDIGALDPLPGGVSIVEQSGGTVLNPNAKHGFLGGAPSGSAVSVAWWDDANHTFGFAFGDALFAFIDANGDGLRDLVAWDEAAGAGVVLTDGPHSIEQHDFVDPAGYGLEGAFPAP